MRSIVKFSQILFLVTFSSLRASFSHASAVSAPVSAPPVSTTKDDMNPVAGIFVMIKDSFVRGIDGTKDMWASHGRCKEIGCTWMAIKKMR